MSCAISPNITIQTNLIYRKFELNAGVGENFQYFDNIWENLSKSHIEIFQWISILNHHSSYCFYIWQQICFHSSSNVISEGTCISGKKLSYLFILDCLFILLFHIITIAFAFNNLYNILITGHPVLTSPLPLFTLTTWLFRNASCRQIVFAKVQCLLLLLMLWTSALTLCAFTFSVTKCVILPDVT